MTDKPPPKPQTPEQLIEQARRARESNGGWLARRTNAEAYHHLYNTKRWKQLRLTVFLRDNYTCAHTGTICSGGKNAPHSPVANHIVRHEGNEDLFFDIDNIETTTKAFHDSAIQSMEKGGRVMRSDGWW